MPRKKKTDDPLSFFGNPYYTGKVSEGPMPVNVGSIRSIPASELNPAWLMQECVNRRTNKLLNRVNGWERYDGGYLITCYLGPHGIHPIPWEQYRVTDFEVEAGKLMEATELDAA